MSEHYHYSLTDWHSSYPPGLHPLYTIHILQYLSCDKSAYFDQDTLDDKLQI